MAAAKPPPVPAQFSADAAGECAVCGAAPAETRRICGDAGHAACAGCWAGHLRVHFVEKKRNFEGLPCVGGGGCRATVTSHTVFEQLVGDDAALAAYAAAYLRTIPPQGLEQAASIADFHYAYDGEGVLRNVSNGELFHWVDQAHYDRLGDLVVEEVQRQMEADYGLQPHSLPPDAADGEETTTVYASPDALTNPERTMYIIQGSGAVRPGQWARALCINDSLRTGTILPYVARAQAQGFAVVVANPNNNGPKDARIRGSESPQAHTVSLWDAFIAPAAARDVVIVAHSAGGACTFALLRERTEQVLARVRCVAFTDAVHWLLPGDPPAVRAFAREHIRDWVASDQPLDTPERPQADGIPCVSAGHTAHVHTSASCMESVFAFVAEKLAAPAPAPPAAAAPGPAGDGLGAFLAARGGGAAPQQWDAAVGMTFDEARALITSGGGAALDVVRVEPGQVVTADVVPSRVRVHVDPEGRVRIAPRTG